MDKKMCKLETARNVMATFIIKEEKIVGYFTSRLKMQFMQCGICGYLLNYLPYDFF